MGRERRGLQGPRRSTCGSLADSTLVKLPPDVDVETALFLGDILATGFFCADMAEAGPEGVYAVLGCGPVGLFAVLGARERGAEHVFAVDVLPERLALAERFGAMPINARESDPREVVREATEGRGADAVLEVVGSPEATRLAFDLVRAGGIVSAVGVHTEAQLRSRRSRPMTRTSPTAPAGVLRADTSSGSYLS
jgi:threonine dehydrogenase-like Zn-dependent dehydrogenase